MLRRKHRGGAKPRGPRAADRNPFNLYAAQFLEWSAARALSDQTVETRQRALRRFIAWCDERELCHPKDVTLPVLERYQRYLYHYRKPNGAPLTFGTQQTLLVPLKAFFQWATRERLLLYNPASELLLPRLPRRLPKHTRKMRSVRHSSVLHRLSRPIAPNSSACSKRRVNARANSNWRAGSARPIRHWRGCWRRCRVKASSRRQSSNRVCNAMR